MQKYIVVGILLFVIVAAYSIFPKIDIGSV